MDKHDRDSLFYSIKEIRQTLRNMETGRQYGAVEVNKKLERIEKKLDLCLQRTDMLDIKAVYTAERLYLEHEGGASYQDLANKSGLTFAQVRNKVAKYKRQLTEQIIGGIDYE
jgi:hypothetical protein